MSLRENWAYGIVEEDQPKLRPLLDALRKLRLRGLTASMVAVAFHRQRVLPLMQRRLRMDQMELGASLEGSWMPHETLPLDEVVWHARWVMGGFKQEDIDRVPMRPNQGFEPLVILSCWSRVLFLPGFLDLAHRGFHAGSDSG
jgi:hypothetical protein